MRVILFFITFLLYSGEIKAIVNPYKIEAIKFSPTDEGGKIVVLTSARPQYKYIKKKEPPSIEVDFLACSFPERLVKEITLPSPPVKEVKLKQRLIEPVKIAQLKILWDKDYPLTLTTEDTALVIHVTYPTEVRLPEIPIPEVLPTPEILVPEILPPLPPIEVLPPLELPPPVPVIPPLELPELPPTVPVIPKEVIPEVKVKEEVIKKPKVKEKVVKKPPEVKPKVPEKPKEVLITLDVRDADIIDVLRLIAYHACVNIVPGPDVKGAVTVKLRDVPWEEALDIILKSIGFTYTKKGKTIRVDKKEKLVPALMPDIESRVIYLAYALPEDVKARLSEVLTKDYGKAEVDTRLNAVIVTDLVSNFPIIEELIAKLDASTPQVLIEAQVVKLREQAAKLLGLSWLAAEVKPDEQIAAGVTFGAMTSAWFRFAKIKDFTQLSLELSALIDKGQGRILAHPKVIALHNKPASIIRGQEIPVITTTYLPGAPGEVARVTTDVSFRTAGTKLTVTPLIGKDMILLKVRPEVSKVAFWKDTPGGPVPAFDTESVDTEILVKDGETIVIGGIIDEEEQVTISKVPILGDLPFLSFFFKHRSVKQDRTELLIFLTTKILRS